MLLDRAIHQLGELHGSLLCTALGEDDENSLAIQHYYLALDLLCQARTQLAIAKLHLGDRKLEPEPEETCIGCGATRARCHCTYFDSERK